MTPRTRWYLTLGAFLVVIGALVGTLCYRSFAIWLAPQKRAIAARSAAAVAADSIFWNTFHGAHYDQLPATIEVLTRAYLATPNDPVTAAHLGWLHMWRISERTRLDSIPATIADEILLARRYFEESVQLDHSDARTLGFLASATLAEGNIQGDDRLVRKGYFILRDAINAWPAFNLFTAGYVLSSLPSQSKQFDEGVAWQWRNLDVCAGQRVDREHPSFTRHMAKITDDRACLNTVIAPHNFEGFFLNMGDMLTKKGDWQLAQEIYANAKLSPDFGTWKFVSVLEERIRSAQTNVARFNKVDPDPKTGLMIGSAFSCMACHQL